MRTIKHYGANGKLHSTTLLEYDNRDRATAGVMSLVNTIYREGVGFPYYRNVKELTLLKADGTVALDRSYVSSFEYNTDGYVVKEVRKFLDGWTSESTDFSYQCK